MTHFPLSQTTALHRQIMASVIDRLLSFLKASPSPFHAVDNVLRELSAVGYLRLRESDPKWTIRRGGKYVLTRNGSSLIAFVVGEQFVMSILDYYYPPFVRIPKKTHSTSLAHTLTAAVCASSRYQGESLGMVSCRSKWSHMGVVYGTLGLIATLDWPAGSLRNALGSIMNDWFLLTSTSMPQQNASPSLFMFRPILRIPTLAIHLDRSVKEGIQVQYRNSLATNTWIVLQ